MEEVDSAVARGVSTLRLNPFSSITPFSTSQIRLPGELSTC
jgi:hypothetical protein